MKQRTKILATIGPSCDTLEKIEELIIAGASIFRLNFSHGTHEYHKKVLNDIKQASKKLNTSVGILQDISGPKVRVKELEETFKLKIGDKIILSKDNIIGKKLNSNEYITSINYPQLLNKIKIDEYIFFYDGTIRTQVIQINPNIIVKVLNDGILNSNKGINFPNTVLNIGAITKKDKEDIKWGIKNKIDYFAISFVQNKNDMILAKNTLGKYKAKLFAKIETLNGVKNIDEILDISDGLMIARGDLGIEVPYYDVPTIQKNLIKKANMHGKPVITATQMLLSMTTNQRATRAEISDVANAVLDGTDVVMLSEETAVGINPKNVVKTMSNIIIKTEEIYNYKKQYKMDYLDIFDVIQSTATKLADDIKAKGIISITSSGTSTIRMSRYRPKTQIFAFSHNNFILRSLNVIWGVKPIKKIKVQSSDKMLNKILNCLKDKNLLDINGPYITTIGYPTGVVGNTNTIKILNKSDIEYYLNI